jgi:hypothetical protein
MSVEVEDNSGAKEQFRSIDATAPEGITVIPYGTRELSGDEYLVYPDGTTTIQKLIEQSGMEYTKFEDRKSSTVVERSEELTIATLYIGYRFLRDNWSQIKFLIQKLSGYYYENSDKEIEMEIEQEDANGDTKKITYRGPANELDSVTEELEAIMDRSSDE